MPESIVRDYMEIKILLRCGHELRHSRSYSTLGEGQELAKILSDVEDVLTYWAEQAKLHEALHASK